MFLQNLSYFNQKDQDDNVLSYSSSYPFNISRLFKKKESQINILKIDIYSETMCSGFDYFSKFIKRVQNIQELEITIKVKLQKQKNNKTSRVEEVLDFLADSIIPQFKDTLEIITFYQFQIQEKSEKDEEKSIKKYLHRIFEPLQSLKSVSFRQTLRETKSADFFALKSFLNILLENPSLLPKFQLLDFEFRETESTIKIKSMEQKELMNIMLKIAKDLAKINKLTELQIGIQNLNLEKNFFDVLIESICKMKQLKKIGLDISKNRITIENSIQNIKKLQPLSGQLESFIYIDSQKFKPSALKEFSQIMKNYENLRFLQIEQMNFKKGQGTEFFSCLSAMHNLQDIRLDLESCTLNEDDYAYFTKQLKSLNHLTSIYLTLPQEAILFSDSTIQILVDLLNHLKDQLTDLSLVFYSKICHQNSVQIVNTISQLKNLKYIYIGFPNDRNSSYNSIIQDARKQNFENIWKSKTISFLPCYQYQSDSIDLIILLKYKILSSQDPEYLEELLLIQHPIDLEKQEKIKENINQMKRYKNLKSYTYKIDYADISSYLNFNTKIIENNQNTLTKLRLSNSYSLRNADMITLIAKCKLLCTLEFNVYFITNEFLEIIFTELVYIQELFIYQTSQFIEQFKIDSDVFLLANYLTDFQCNQIDLMELQIYKQLPLKRKVYILQNLIYTQLIQPELLYKPQLSHQDIVID